MSDTLNRWLDLSLRQLREEFRTAAEFSIHGETLLCLEALEKVETTLKSTTSYLRKILTDTESENVL